jgi:LysM repeat protein
MKTRILIALLLIAVTTACSLSNASENTDTTETPEATATEVAQIATATPRPTSTPAPTNTPPPSPTVSTGNGGGNTIPTTAPVCTPRTDWTTFHTIQNGDTLSNIALRAGTTVNTLAQGNCIADINRIIVGTQIRVPRALTAPPTATFATLEPPLSQQPPERVGGAAPSEIISGDAGFVQLVRDSAITVRWENPPANIVRVQFLVLPPGWTFDHAGPGTIEIGTDTNGANGWSVPWSVPASLSGELVAFGFGTSGRLNYYSWPLVVTSADPAITGCRIRTVGDAVVNFHDEPEAGSPVVGQLDSLNAVPILGRSLSGWYAISTNIDFSGVGGVAMLAWIPPNAAVEEVQPCL